MTNANLEAAVSRPKAEGDSVTDPIPILIGISGKRVLNEDVELDRALSAELGRRFRRLFEAIDARTPNTPKVIVAGAAFGADLIAAQTALELSGNFFVVSLLPFARDLFEEDFDAEFDKKRKDAWAQRYSEHRAAFDHVMAAADWNPRRAIVREMPALDVDDGAPGRRLSKRGEDYDAAYRHNHYEQVGQHIAEIATIMVVVMAEDERPNTKEADGGTARVAACRRAGRADDKGADVARRSAVLRRDWPEIEPLPGGYIWLIDPYKPEPEGDYPARALGPLLDRSVEHIYAGRPAKDLEKEDERYVGPLVRAAKCARRLGFGERGAAMREARDADAALIWASLRLPRALNRYNSGRLRNAGSFPLNVADLNDVPKALNVARLGLSRRQGKINTWSKHTATGLAALFVFAVLLLEMNAKSPDERLIWFGGYILVTSVMIVLALYARMQRWEAAAEDYRAVAEMLRVQHAWMAAGLRKRVDWENLQGVDADLASIRDCARTVIAWHILRHPGLGVKPARDWAHVRGLSAEPRDIGEKKKPPKDWVGGQLWYFAVNQQKREAMAAWNDTASWCLFAAASTLAFVVEFCLWLRWPASSLLNLSHIGASCMPDFGFIVWSLIGALVVIFRANNHDLREGRWALGISGVMGVIAAAFFALAAADLSQCMPLLSHENGSKESLVEETMISFIVLLSAIAGAMRYRMEKLNTEAEALEYRDARQRFERAERTLAQGTNPLTGAPIDEKAAQSLVLELGRLALDENESWLKSRRERPLTPIVG